MGSKKEKKGKKEKKEKKSKKQKVEHDDEDDHQQQAVEEKVDGLPPSFYEEIEEPAKENDEKQDETAEGEDNDAAKPKRKRKRKRKRKADDENDEDAAADQNETANDSETAGDLTQDTIFVEGIPFDATVDTVRAFFVDTHGIASGEVLELRLPTWQDTGRLRGFGHVRFASAKSYQAALALNGKYLGKRYLTIQASHRPSGNRSGTSVENPSLECPPGCCTIYINNLPYGATEDTIAQAVGKHAKLSLSEESVRIARNSLNRQSKGFAYVDFETTEDAQKLMKAAIKKSLLVGGRMVRLDYDTGRAKGSFRTESGKLLQKHFKD